MLFLVKKKIYMRAFLLLLDHAGIRCFLSVPFLLLHSPFNIKKAIWQRIPLLSLLLCEFGPGHTIQNESFFSLPSIKTEERKGVVQLIYDFTTFSWTLKALSKYRLSVIDNLNIMINNFLYLLINSSCLHPWLLSCGVGGWFI